MDRINVEPRAPQSPTSSMGSAMEIDEDGRRTPTQGNNSDYSTMPSPQFQNDSPSNRSSGSFAHPPLSPEAQEQLIPTRMAFIPTHSRHTSSSSSGNMNMGSPQSLPTMATATPEPESPQRYFNRNSISSSNSSSDDQNLLPRSYYQEIEQRALAQNRRNNEEGLNDSD